MVDCISSSLLLGSNHAPFSDSFQAPLQHSNFTSSNHGPSQGSTIIFHGLIHYSWLLPLRSKHLILILRINAKNGRDVIRASHTSRLYPGLYAVIKTMPRMWIQLLCACVLYSMGSRGLKQWMWRHKSHMGEMRDSDWSRPKILRSDWLLLFGASMTTNGVNRKRDSKSLDSCVCIEVLQGTSGTRMVTILFGPFHHPCFTS